MWKELEPHMKSRIVAGLTWEDNEYVTWNKTKEKEKLLFMCLIFISLHILQGFKVFCLYFIGQYMAWRSWFLSFVWMFAETMAVFEIAGGSTWWWKEAKSSETMLIFQKATEMGRCVKETKRERWVNKSKGHESELSNQLRRRVKKVIEECDTKCQMCSGFSRPGLSPFRWMCYLGSVYGQLWGQFWCPIGEVKFCFCAYSSTVTALWKIRRQ